MTVGQLLKEIERERQYYSDIDDFEVKMVEEIISHPANTQTLDTCVKDLTVDFPDNSVLLWGF